MDYYKVAICIPSRGLWDSNFGQSLALMTCGSLSLIDKPIAYKLMNMHGSILATQRADMIRQCLKDEAENKEPFTHILMLDDDMKFPFDTLAKFIAHEVDIVAANCATKVYPPKPTARRDKKEVYTTAVSTGLEEVDRIGCAVMLVKMDVFRKLEQPWFATPWCEKQGGIIGEDVFFCNRAREIGYKVFIDHDVSKQVGHIGWFEYRHQLMEQYEPR